MAKPYKRRKKLINPRFQLKLACAGLAISLVSVMVLMILLNEAILEMMDSGWVDPISVQSGWVGMLAGKLLLAALLLIPLTIALGIILTHRIAGPMYRFEKYLRDILDGKNPRPCTIRKGDEFQKFCDLLNQVTRPLCEEEPSAKAKDAAEAPVPVAAAAKHAESVAS